MRYHVRTLRMLAVVGASALAVCTGPEVALAASKPAIAAPAGSQPSSNPASLPSPTVKPSSVAAGGTVTVSGTSCRRNGNLPVDAFVALVDSTGAVLSSAYGSLSASGSWQVTLTVPAATSPGTYEVDSTCDRYTTQQSYPPVSLAVTAATVESFTDQPTPNPTSPNGDLAAVSCGSPGHCIAVGRSTNDSGYSVPLGEVASGTTWTLQAVPAPSAATSSGLASVSCASATACVAVGDETLSSGVQQAFSEVLSGATWSLHATPGPAGATSATLAGISCTAATSCQAVGSAYTSRGDEPLIEAWNGSTWSIEAAANPPGSTYAPLSAVSCFSPMACVAVGNFYDSSGQDSTLAERWNGSSWTIQATPDPAGADSSVLTAVSCTSTTACTAVGSDFSDSTGTESTLGEALAGSTWSVQPTPNPPGYYAQLAGVSCTGMGSCVAAGYSYDPSSGEEVTVAETRTASGWVLDSTPDATNSIGSPLAGVSCTSASACLAVGVANLSSSAQVTFAISLSGTTWTVASTANPDGADNSVLNAVSCITASRCIAVGASTPTNGSSETLAESWNGSAWSILSTPDPSGSSSAVLASVSCASASACTAVGESISASGSGATLVEGWNGTTWTVQPSPNPQGATNPTLTGVSCSTATACTAVGSAYASNGHQETLAENWDGTTWSIQATPNASGTASALAGVSCASPTACTAVGHSISNVEAPLIEALTGSTWSLQTAPNPNKSSVLNAVSCTSPTSCTGVGASDGSGGQVSVVEHWNGKSWAVQASANGNGGGGLYGVSCSGSTSCTAVGWYYSNTGQSSLAEVDQGGKWTEQTTPAVGGNDALLAVSCTSATACAAAGSDDPSTPVTLVDVEGGA